MKKGTKSTGVIDSWKPSSTIRLEGAHAKGTVAQKVGSVHTLTIKAKKTGHNVNSDGTHSATYEPTSVGFQQGSADNDGQDNQAE